MALRGVRVVELAGLAPAPFCGMLLADFGATVTKVERKDGANFQTLSSGKRSIALNLKHPDGKEVLRKLCMHSDVLLEPYRQGTMERLGLGPKELLTDNPRLIYARLTGFGQTGPFSKMAGHDINYVALSGLLSMLGRAGERPTPPINLMADFAGGGLLCAFGIVMALLERTQSGRGQVIDANMVEGSAYLGSWIFRSQNLPIWRSSRGKNELDCGAHFYDTYETADGRFMAVGALEPQFYSQLMAGLGLDENELPQDADWDEAKRVLARRFKERTQSEWCAVFDGTDACVTPVLSMSEAPSHVHNAARSSFLVQGDAGGQEVVPLPAPRLSRTPASSRAVEDPDGPEPGRDTVAILQELGYSAADVKRFINEGAVEAAEVTSKL